MSYHQQATIIIIMSTQIIVIEINIFLWSILTVLLSHALFFCYNYFIFVVLFCICQGNPILRVTF